MRDSPSSKKGSRTKESVKTSARVRGRLSKIKEREKDPKVNISIKLWSPARYENEKVVPLPIKQPKMVVQDT